MEKKKKKKKPNLSKMSSSAENVVGSFRDALPTHFSFKISSFSNLATSPMEKYESNVFDAGGYKWKLLFYPNGNSTDNGENHISMYLEMVETSSLPPGWVADVFFRFFVLDRIKDKYLILGDHKWFSSTSSGGGWGTVKIIKLVELEDHTKGFLVNDTCIIEAEVTVCGVVKKLSTT